MGLTKRGRCHGLGVNGGLSICGGQIWASVIPAFVVIVFDIEAGEFGEANSQGTAGVVDVLPIQRLKETVQLQINTAANVAIKAIVKIP